MSFGKRLSEVALLQNPGYDPSLCKTCQKLGLDKPALARARYSDCEEHYQKRIRNLWLTGVKIIS